MTALLAGWVLFALAAGVCGMTLWELLHERKETARLLAENKTLLATALEAKGVMYVNPDEPRQVREVPVSRAVTRKVAGKLIELEQRDARRAHEREQRIKSEAVQRTPEEQGA